MIGKLEEAPSSSQKSASSESTALLQERERLQLILASIGDAVISTNAEGRITFMNPVAEGLTGVRQARAIGQSISAVFKIIHEETREPVDNPVLRALREGQVVNLANHTLLIASDGSEHPIDDSAAPMRGADGEMLGAVLVFRDISERRRAEEAQAQLAAIVQSSEDAILSKTLDGIIRSWNAAAQRLFGYTAEEVIGQPVTVLIPPDRIDEERLILSRLRQGERIEHFETIRVTKSGQPLDISLTISPIKDQHGRIIGASKIARDITGRKRDEIALRESEARHRFLVDLTSATQELTDPTQVMATTARILAEHLGVDRCAYAEVENETAYTITGDYRRDVPSMVGGWPLAAFGTECVRCMLANEPYVVNDVSQELHEELAIQTYRRTATAALICVPLHKSGKFVAAIAVHQKTPRIWTRHELQLVRTVVNRSWESLERVRVARGLKEAAEHLALAVSAASLGDWSWDAATDIVNLSPRAGQIFGVPSGSALTWTVMQTMIHPDDRNLARVAVEQAVAKNQQYDVEYRVNRHGTEEVWVSAKGRAQYSPNGAALGMFGVLQDITEPKRLERDLRQRALELAEADKQKNEFIALLAHELRNPLAPVRTGLQVMRLAAADEKAVAKAQGMMERQLGHMVRLIDDLLDISRMSRNRLHLQKSEVTLSEVLYHAREAAGPAIEAAGHQLELSLPATPILLHADLTRLAQVFGNLLTNSAKYTPQAAKIWLTAEVAGNYAVITVKDTGIGIPAADLPHVFDMFSQVGRSIERVSGGLGIGLALVKGLVESHGGSVHAESPGTGRGSTFTVRLPLLQKTPLLNPELGATPLPRTTRQVLVVDDNHDAAESMAELLQLLGNEVHVAHDGIEAVELAERVRPALILMDVGMPRLSGLEATRQIRAHAWGKQITIVALTGWGQESDREQSRAAGCNKHLVKPVSIDQLEQLLTAPD